MSEVVESLKPLPALKDMASSSIYFQTVQSDGSGRAQMAETGPNFKTSSLQENGTEHPRSLSISSSTCA
ncbi:putative non-specific serine/threonine protein kinase [Helianthus debilis subsp. tardiflorus]